MKQINLNKILIGLYSIIAAFIIITLSTGSLLVENNLTLTVLIVIILAVVFVINNIEEFVIQFTTFRKIDVIILVAVTTLLLITSFIWKDTLFGVVTTLTGILTVLQASRGSIWTFFWGALNVLFYAMIAYFNDYAGDFILNAFFNVPMQVIGVYYWNKNYKQEQHEVKKRIFELKDYLITLVAVAVGTVVISYIMPVINNALFMDSNPLPFVDALTTTASIAAQILMTKRYREQWLLWIIINVGSIIMWLVKGDITMVVMWSAYLVNSVYGYIKWGEE